MKRIDPCMRQFVEFINKETQFKTIMSCCGHGKYPMSLIVIDLTEADWAIKPMEIFSGVQFKRERKRFYKKDKQGYYYIPEVVDEAFKRK